MKFPASIEQAGNQIICLYAKLHIQPYLCSCDYAYMHRHIAGNEKDTNYKETGIRDYRLYHARPGRRGLFCKRNAVYTAVLSVVKRSGTSSAESDLSAAYLTSDPSLHIILLLCCVSSGESICYEQTNAAVNPVCVIVREIRGIWQSASTGMAPGIVGIYRLRTVRLRFDKLRIDWRACA